MNKILTMKTSYCGSMANVGYQARRIAKVAKAGKLSVFQEESIVWLERCIMTNHAKLMT